ncbi:MAG: tetratricopeptide repeat protein [bacterium]|nr:tetratricopeptide repeat protein [bacterium]
MADPYESSVDAGPATSTSSPGRAPSAPDVEIVVREGDRAGRSVLTYELKAGGRKYGRFGPVELRQDPRRYFQERFKDIESLSLRDPTARETAQRKLAGIGSTLAIQLLPEDLDKWLRELKNDDADPAPTLLIRSDEGWIPWELLKLRPWGEGSSESGPFLCEAFALRRWQGGVPEHLRLPLRRLALVATRDPKLSASAEECETIKSLAGARRTISEIPARYLEVTDQMAAASYDGWHFTGHGVARSDDPNRWSILFEDHTELTPEDLNDKAAHFGQTHPLVFFNACHTAKGALSLTGVGGWAAQLLRVGAGAFIGASWATTDQPATAFATAFYHEFLRGVPIAEAVRRARLAIREEFPGDPTWLAYALYAHPLASCHSGELIEKKEESRSRPAGHEEVPLQRAIPAPASQPILRQTTLVRALRYFAWFAVVLIVLIAALRGWQHWQARDHYNRGTELVQKGRPAAAREKFEAALALNPRFAEATANLAELAALDGNIRDARKHYRAAVAVEPENALFQYNLGNFLGVRGEYEEAIEPLRRAIEIRSDYVEAYNELGNAYLGLARPADAREVLEAGLAIGPTEAALNKNLARACLAEEGATEAIQYLNLALRHYDPGDPGRMEARFLLAKAHAQLAQQEETCQQLRKFRNITGSAESRWAPEARDLAAEHGCPIEF